MTCAATVQKEGVGFHGQLGVAADPAFVPVATPVSLEYLRSEGLSDVFIKYMRNWKGFVTDPVEEPASV